MKTLALGLLILLSTQALAQTAVPTPIQRDLSFWEKLKALVKISDSYLYGDIDSYGLSWRSLGKVSRYSWYGLRRKIRQEVKRSHCRDLDCPGYIEELASLTGARLSKAVRVEWLTDMPTAFAKRWSLIDQAEESIYILTWGIYDDATGTMLAERLLRRLAERPELDIRIVVDKKVALLEHHRAVLENLRTASEGRIQVIQWHTPQYRAHVQHRKLMVVDGEHVMLGGTNLGDVYSHISGDELWKDADVYLVGRGIGAQAHAQFAEIWNDQLLENPDTKGFARIEPRTFVEDGIVPTLLIDHNPGTSVRKSDHNILTAMYKLMRDARESIDIENAYFVLDPVMRDALKQALKRGVRVRIYTNSVASIDIPFLGSFVASSARQALGYGAEVYLKTGATLHSKYMVVDGKVGVIGSHNMHPRSQALDGENVVAVFDPDIVAGLQASFEEGLLDAFQPRSGREVGADRSLIDFVFGTLLFDHL